ncbi:hypothetical protein D4L85_31800 [Chryseolinea soli]|uniref:Uncharacterized protein n=1 Tax=Chryseolinea soli TaxID=2321403 RepID=A0A385SWF5_9BACT|nr:hypothetical protein D4L85_31800 [Chryseolinea soli]
MASSHIGKPSEMSPAFLRAYSSAVSFKDNTLLLSLTLSYLKQHQIYEYGYNNVMDEFQTSYLAAFLVERFTSNGVREILLNVLGALEFCISSVISPSVAF